MSGKLKVIGLLLTPLLITLSSTPNVSADNDSSNYQHQEHKAQSKGSVWLVVVGGTRAGWTHTNIATIEMESIDLCESQGIRMSSSKDFRQGIFDEINYICIKGK